MARARSIGAVVLCGGESRRMGRDKATLPFGPETMLERVVRVLSEIAHPIAVAAAADQSLPELAHSIAIVRDPAVGQGPWQGVAAGMRALADECDFVFVVGCDSPFLRPDWVRQLGDLIGDHAAAVPVVDGYLQPMSALYRPAAVLPTMEQLQRETGASPLALFDRVPTRRVLADELRDIDPTFESLRNINTPEDYRRALVDASFPGI